MEMETKLKPCPFCASENLRTSKNFGIYERELKETVVYIECLNCGCDGPKIAYVDDPEKEWNERS
jgi:hypothetical protein